MLKIGPIMFTYLKVWRCILKLQNMYLPTEKKSTPLFLKVNRYMVEK